MRYSLESFVPNKSQSTNTKCSSDKTWYRRSAALKYALPRGIQLEYCLEGNLLQKFFRTLTNVSRYINAGFRRAFVTAEADMRKLSSPKWWISTTLNARDGSYAPKWPTVGSYPNVKSAVSPETVTILDAKDLIDKYTKFVSFVEAISKITDKSKATSQIVDAFKRYLQDAVFVNKHDVETQYLDQNSLSLGIKTVQAKWPTDEWFRDSNYRIYDKIRSLDTRLGVAAGNLAKLPRGILSMKDEDIGDADTKTVRNYKQMCELIFNTHVRLLRSVYSTAGTLYKFEKSLGKVDYVDPED